MPTNTQSTPPSLNPTNYVTATWSNTITINQHYQQYWSHHRLNKNQSLNSTTATLSTTSNIIKPTRTNITQRQHQDHNIPPQSARQELFFSTWSQDIENYMLYLLVYYVQMYAEN